MLHTRFRVNWPTGSGEEDFEGFLIYMGAGNKLSFPLPMEGSHKILT